MIESNNPSAVRSKIEITQALLKLMGEYPYSEITVKQIILTSSLARKTFYRNFESKDDVLCSLIKKSFREYFDIVNNARGDVLTTIFSYAEKNRDILMLLEKNDMLHLVLKCMNEDGPLLRKNEVSASNPFNELFEGLDSEYLIALNNGAVWNVMALWVHRGMKEDPQIVRNTVEEYLKRIKNNTFGF